MMSTPTPASTRASGPVAAAAAAAAVAAAQTPTTAAGRRPPTDGATPVSAFRTPTARAILSVTSAARRTPGTAGGGGHASAARTPHARAARLALDHRRTALFTPGGRQSRRKSGRVLRDSPRDLLRNLSRRLAPTSQAIASSSPGGSSSGGSANRSRRQSRRSAAAEDVDIDIDIDTTPESRVVGRSAAAARRRSNLAALGDAADDNDDDDDDDDDSSLPLTRPRMSLPIDDDDDDDDLRPHHSTILENGGGSDDLDPDADLANFTMRSIELARRAATQEQLLQARRFSRGSLGRSSFGSMRMSDYIEGFIGGTDDDDNTNLLALEEQARANSAFFADDAFDNLLDNVASAADGNADADADATFERLDSDMDTQTPERQEALAADAAAAVAAGNDTTFLLGQPPSPSRTLDPALVVDDGEGGEAGEVGGAAWDGADDYANDNDAGNMWFDEPEPDDEEGETAAVDAMAVTADSAAVGDAVRVGQHLEARGASARKKLKLSAHGIPYPSLPAGVIKRIAQTFAQSAGAGKGKLGADTVAALSTASDWFFEQVGMDLHRYAKHANRKTIDESDMLLLMRRQRQVNATVTPFSLAQRLLPRELLQELRMMPDAPALKRRRTQRTSSGPRRVGRLAGKEMT